MQTKPNMSQATTKAELQIKQSISQVKEKEESVNKIYMYCVLYKKRKEGRS